MAVLVCANKSILAHVDNCIYDVLQAVQAVAAPTQQTKTGQKTAHKLTIDKSTRKPRVVILGSGWGAVSLLKQLPKHIRFNEHIKLLPGYTALVSELHTA